MDATGEIMKGKILISFAIIYLVWGSTFTAIKVGLESFPPIALAGSRFMLAGMIFLALSKFRDFKTLTKSDLKNEVLVGVLLNFGNAGVCWSEKYLSSGVAALIVGAIPIVFMLFNWIGFEKKVPHISAFLAVIFGITGISLISSDHESSSDWRVIAVLLLANFSWVLGSLRFRMSKSHLAYYPRAAVQLISGGATLYVFSHFFDEDLNFSAVSLNGYLSVIFLAVAGTVIAYTAYSYLLKNVAPEVTSTYALINPLVALLLGIFFLGERFTPTIYVSAGLILLSVILTLYGERIWKFRKSEIPLPVKDEVKDLETYVS